MPASKPQPEITVASFLTMQIDRSDKSQREIGLDIGYKNPNVMSMIKLGRTKLPLKKVGPLARSLEIDPVHLLRLTLLEYAPDTLAAIEDALGSTLLTEAERGMVTASRVAGSASA